MEIVMELLEELTKDDSMMWVVGGGSVVSENNSKGIQKPERHNQSVTVEAENWHFHISLNDVAAIQFVETKTHGERLSYYVRFRATRNRLCSEAISPTHSSTKVTSLRLSNPTGSRRSLTCETGTWAGTA